ncbi:hypothetical protein ACET3Z_025330 [Daucus carota]
MTLEDAHAKELEKEKNRAITHVEFFEITHGSEFWMLTAKRMKDVLVKLWDEYRDSQIQLGDDLLQQAIGTAALIAHAKANVDSVLSSELDYDVQHLAAEAIPTDHSHFAKYVKFVSMAVEKILSTNGKTIIQDDTTSDPNDGDTFDHDDIPHFSEDE